MTHLLFILGMLIYLIVIILSIVGLVLSTKGKISEKTDQFLKDLSFTIYLIGCALILISYYFK